MNYKKNTYGEEAMNTITSWVIGITFVVSIIIFFGVLYDGISKSDDRSEQNCANQYCDLVLLEKDFLTSDAVYYDRNTNVMYYCLGRSELNSGLTPIYNADGTLKLYESEER